jgi:hypothetical protein
MNRMILTRKIMQFIIQVTKGVGLLTEVMSMISYNSFQVMNFETLLFKRSYYTEGAFNR